jgi:hypothetical protein
MTYMAPKPQGRIAFLRTDKRKPLQNTVNFLFGERGHPKNAGNVYIQIKSGHLGPKLWI